MARNKKEDLGKFVEHKPCCSVTVYGEGNCKIILPPGRSQWICLSGTKYQTVHKHSAKLCDLLFAWDNSSAQRLSCVLELKGGGMSVSGVVGQLQEGARIVEELLLDLEVQFMPLLVHRHMVKVQIDALSRQKIRFRGKPYSIKLARCGLRLIDLNW
jgi:hypothetical protein